MAMATALHSRRMLWRLLCKRALGQRPTASWDGSMVRRWGGAGPEGSARASALDLMNQLQGDAARFAVADMCCVLCSADACAERVCGGAPPLCAAKQP